MFSQQLVNGVMLGSIYALVGVSFTMTIGILNFLNFSIPSIFMLGGMMSWAFIVWGGLPWFVGVALGIATGGVASLVVERFTYRRLKNSHPDVPLISSVGFLVLFENLVIVYFGAYIQRFPTPFGDANLRVAGLVVSIPQLCSLLITAILVLTLHYILRRTQLGRSLRAIAENPNTALVVGINANQIVPMLFLISGIFTALGGVIFATNYHQVSPFIGNEVTLKGVAAMIIGGMGNIWGAVLGGLLLGLTEAVSIHVFGGSVAEVVIFAFIILLICVLPTGLFGDRNIRSERV
ncbi:MAG: branched-chain amino acid ABC transporter permease [Pseudorhodoplanes sp.]|uniref:branched-chain amino acid ABC transporter permease n=1 Tax=Pseudorhodoplanes sp. TaxID=1934341 RepID=UPI003D0D7B9E